MDYKRFLHQGHRAHWDSCSPATPRSRRGSSGRLRTLSFLRERNSRFVGRKANYRRLAPGAVCVLLILIVFAGIPSQTKCREFNLGVWGLHWNKASQPWDSWRLGGVLLW